MANVEKKFMGNMQKVYEECIVILDEWHEHMNTETMNDILEYHTSTLPLAYSSIVAETVEYIALGFDTDYGTMTYKRPDDVMVDVMDYELINALKEHYQTKYIWTAKCDDNEWDDKSTKEFDTAEECYNDMRDHALEKMKWNTQFAEDFDTDDPINYQVTFEQGKITHKSYSGLYTYTIQKIFR